MEVIIATWVGGLFGYVLAMRLGMRRVTEAQDRVNEMRETVARERLLSRLDTGDKA